mmetsp:Transcript_8905/g.14441  ORF Transcript_8905/g.14441 Transcript_8905/m.14441 type:complete len:339 (+) Transcript_8905:126-1142(+)
MDYLSAASDSLGGTSSATAPRGYMLEYVIGVVVALAVLRLEVKRRTADLPQSGRGWRMKECTKFLLQHAPEAAGLAACLSLAVALRFQNSFDANLDAKTWEAIVREWPILLTADSLLALQAMLRVLVYLSVALRAAPSPISGEVAFIFCGAAVGRAVLASKSDVYLLDGPLGGFVPIIFEFASVPLLAYLSRGVCRNGFLACAFTLSVAACLACRNCLALANDAFIDGLFIFAHVTELIASFAYLCRSLMLDVRVIGMGRNSVALRFAHIIMFIQQTLSAYYFVHAFQYSSSLVGIGHPFEILQMGGVAQLAAFGSASMVLVAEYFSPDDEAVEVVAH